MLSLPSEESLALHMDSPPSSPGSPHPVLRSSEKQEQDPTQEPTLHDQTDRCLVATLATLRGTEYSRVREYGRPP